MGQYSGIQQKMEERLSALQRRVERIESDRRREGGALDPDFEEQVVERENDDVLDALDVSGRSELEELRTALQRMESGTYGVCIRCDEVIPLARLEAMPSAITCVGCAD